jgi:hypothetical protein
MIQSALASHTVTEKITMNAAAARRRRSIRIDIIHVAT